MNENRISIIVINYKNYYDTIECLESLFRFQLGNSQIILLDNYSCNESIIKLQEWLDINQSIKSKTLTENEFIINAKVGSFKEYELLFIKANENKGFAGGNNFIINTVLDNFDFFLLFNNDAICVNNVVEILRENMIKYTDYSACTCRINHYYSPQLLQQMGGELLWFGHFKRYNEKFLMKCLIKGKHVIPVTFATGCVLMIRKEILKTFGFLSTKIFFGEEDVELALRFKNNNLKLVSFIDAIVLHKGGGAQKESSSNHIDAGYAHSMIGRSVMLKNYYGRLHWYTWFFLFQIMMALNILIRRRLGLKRTIKIFKVINKYVLSRNTITKEDFFQIINEFN